MNSINTPDFELQAILQTDELNILGELNSEDESLTCVLERTQVINAYPSFISNETGTWFFYDENTERYVDSGIVGDGSIICLSGVTDDFIISDDRLLQLNTSAVIGTIQIDNLFTE